MEKTRKNCINNRERRLLIGNYREANGKENYYYLAHDRAYDQLPIVTF